MAWHGDPGPERIFLLGSSLPFRHPLIREVMKPVSDILGAERSTLFLGDKKNRTLYAIVNRGNEDIMIEIPDHKGIAGSVYTNTVSLNISDCYADPRFAKQVDKASSFQTKTMLCAPIRHMQTGESLGVIQAINKIGGNFTAADESRITHLCEIVARIIPCIEKISRTCSHSSLSRCRNPLGILVSLSIEQYRMSWLVVKTCGTYIDFSSCSILREVENRNYFGQTSSLQRSL